MANRPRKTSHGSPDAGARQARRQAELWRKRAEGLAERHRRLVDVLHRRADVSHELRDALLAVLGVPQQP